MGPLLSGVLVLIACAIFLSITNRTADRNPPKKTATLRLAWQLGLVVGTGYVVVGLWQMHNLWLGLGCVGIAVVALLLQRRVRVWQRPTSSVRRQNSAAAFGRWFALIVALIGVFWVIDGLVRSEPVLIAAGLAFLAVAASQAVTHRRWRRTDAKP